MQFLLLLGSLLASIGLLVSLVSGDAAGLRNVEEAVAVHEVKRALAPRDTVTTTITVYQCSTTATSTVPLPPASYSTGAPPGVPPVSTSIPVTAPSTSAVLSTASLITPSASYGSSAPPAPPASGSSTAESTTTPPGPPPPPSTATSSPGAPPATESNTSVVPPPTESSASGTTLITASSSITVTSLESIVTKSNPPTGTHSGAGSHTSTPPSSTIPVAHGSSNHVSYSMFAVIAGMGFAALAAV